MPISIPCYERPFRQISDTPIMHATNSQSVISEFIRPRKIQGLDRGGRHVFSIEVLYFYKECGSNAYRKEPSAPIRRKITLRKLHLLTRK